jgi:P-type Mg2+ transporter
VIFVIRTRRVPFFRSIASAPMALAAVGVTIIGAVLPYTGRLARVLGFQPLPGAFFLALAGIVVVYLALVEVVKYWFFRLYHPPAAPAPRHRRAGYRVYRRAARFAARTIRPVISAGTVGRLRSGD